MPLLQQERTGVFNGVVRHSGRWGKRSLETKSRAKSEAELKDINNALKLIKRGEIEVPDDVEPIELAIAKGRVTDRAVAPQRPLKPAA